MSRRHQQSRRRSYGRRQHEVRERRERLESSLREEREDGIVVGIESAADRLGRLAFGPAGLAWAEGAA